MKKSAFVLLSLWYLFAFITSKPFLPYPHLVLLHTLKAFLNGILATHLAISAYRIIIALAGATVTAAVFALTAGRIPKADRFLTPFAYILYPIPKVALLPVIMLFLGLGNLSKFFFIAIVVFFQLYFVIRDAAHAIDQHYIDSVRSLGASRSEMLIHVIIPAVLPSLFTALRVSTGTATAILFLAETFATTTGLGWYIMDSWARLDYLDMYAGITALSLLATSLFVLFSFLDRKLCPWMHLKDQNE